MEKELIKLILLDVVNRINYTRKMVCETDIVGDMYRFNDNLFDRIDYSVDKVVFNRNAEVDKDKINGHILNAVHYISMWEDDRRNTKFKDWYDKCINVLNFAAESLIGEKIA